MKLNLDHVSPALRKRIEDQIAAEDRARMGAVGAEKSEPQKALERGLQARQASIGRMVEGGPIVRVTIISFRKRELDRDNLIGGCKPLRDAIARWLGIDDSDRCITWEYGQHQTNGNVGTAVKIEQT